MIKLAFYSDSLNLCIKKEFNDKKIKKVNGVAKDKCNTNMVNEGSTWFWVNINDENELEGEIYENMDYTSIGFAKRFNQAKFVEMVGEVVTVKAEDNENSGIRGNKTTTKKVITYVMIN